MTTISDTNASGFITFKSRDFGFAGDKGTWARFDDGTRQLTINRAAKGGMSSAYTDEMREFAAQYGVDFDDMKTGERRTATGA